MSNPSKRYYPLIDGIRFLSAFIVVIHHFAFNNSRVSTIPEYFIDFFNGWFDYGLLTQIAKVGWVGVDYFFVISGFVISGSIEKGTQKFIKGRYMRLFPTLYFFATLSLISTLLVSDINFFKVLILWLKSIFLFPVGPWIDGVYWSLVVELTFYLLVLLFWIVFRKKSIVILMYFLTLISTIGVITYFISIAFDLIYLKTFITSYKSKLLLITTGCAFAFGIVLQILKREGFQLQYLVAAIMNFLFILIWIFNKSLAYLDVYQSIILITFSTLILSILVFDVYHQLNYPNKLLKVTKILGGATYPMYLLHNVTGSLVLVWLVKQGFGVWNSLLISVLLVVVASVIYNLKIEKNINLLVESIPRYFIRFIA